MKMPGMNVAIDARWLKVKDKGMVKWGKKKTTISLKFQIKCYSVIAGKF